jgi:hypothetical protein
MDLMELRLNARLEPSLESDSRAYPCHYQRQNLETPETDLGFLKARVSKLCTEDFNKTN